MKDGLYRLHIANRFGMVDRFPASLSQGELTAWNEHFSLPGTVNYYTSEIHIIQKVKERVNDSILDEHTQYSFKGKSSFHEDGFTVFDTDGPLNIVIVAIRDFQILDY